MSNTANPDFNVVTISSYIVGDKFVFLSDDLPGLYASNKNYTTAYNEMAYSLDPLLSEKFKDSKKQIKIEWEVAEGTYSLH